MSKEKIVSKLSTSLLADRDKGVLIDEVDHHIGGILAAHPDKAHIFVTSGARETGLYRARTIFGREKAEKLDSKTLAGLGATTLFYMVEQAAERHGVAASSIEVTHHQLDGDGDPVTMEEVRSLKQFVEDNARLDIASIFNEGHAFNDAELMQLLLGIDREIDNDALAAHITTAVGADYLDIWTKKGGIHDDSGQHIPVIDMGNIKSVREMLVYREGSLTGTGGPGSKVEAAWSAAMAGAQVRILGVNEDMSGHDITTVVVR